MMGYAWYNHWLATLITSRTDPGANPDADLLHPDLVAAIRKVTMHYLWLFKVWWGIIVFPNDVTIMNPSQPQNI